MPLGMKQPCPNRSTWRIDVPAIDKKTSPSWFSDGGRLDAGVDTQAIARGTVFEGRGVKNLIANF